MTLSVLARPAETYQLSSGKTWENWHSDCENRQLWTECELTAARPYDLSCALLYITAAVYREDLRPACLVCCICTNACHLCSRLRIAPGDSIVCSVEVFALCCWFSGKLPTVARPSFTRIFLSCLYDGLGADFYQNGIFNLADKERKRDLLFFQRSLFKHVTWKSRQELSVVFHFRKRSRIALNMKIKKSSSQQLQPTLSSNEQAELHQLRLRDINSFLYTSRCVCWSWIYWTLFHLMKLFIMHVKIGYYIKRKK